MKIVPAGLNEVFIIEPTIYSDARGHFFESYHSRETRRALNIPHDFVQDNHSLSRRKVLRGLHYQIRHPQGKLVRVVKGRVFDVAVDLRKSSASFGQWTGIELSDANHRELWVPPGFAHGFVTLSEEAVFLYKTTDYYMPEHERCIRWDDPGIGIEWPIDFEPILSIKDSQGSTLDKAEVFS